VPTAVLVTLLLQEYLVQKDVQEQSSLSAPDE
jgi:hypothetical protein